MDCDYKQIFDQMPCGVMVIDKQGRIIMANPSASAILGGNHDKGADLHLDSLISDEALRKIVIHFTDSRDAIPPLIMHHLDRILQLTGRSFTLGGNMAIVVTVEDMSHNVRREAEEKRQVRYAVMGELSADIAHEFRNPLGSIELLASLFRKELRRKKDINRAEQILDAVQNMENKISSLIQFSKIYQNPVHLVNLHDILRDILQSANSHKEKDLPFISSQFADCEPIVSCNPEMLKQVFLTLILNILQSLSATNRLDIETRQRTEQIEVHFIERTIGSRDAMTASLNDRFSPSKVNRLGLGLAIIHNIINLYRGSLSLQYLKNVGTSFVLSFPLWAGEDSTKTQPDKER